MAEIQELRCVIGDCRYQGDALAYTCPVHGEVGTLDILYDYAGLARELDRDAIAASREPNLWRYRSLLPIAPDCPVPPLDAGWTPLYPAPRIARSLGIERAWIKDEGANPTASLKDRASALVLARALELNFATVSTASTGNAAAALAGLGASLPEIDIVIFVPATAPAAKIAQLLVYGAEVLLVDGSYDDAFELCMEACQAEGWYSRNTGVNPFTTEGKKTAALEIAEQLSWQPPDAVIVSVGDGSIISGLYKGFYDLKRSGLDRAGSAPHRRTGGGQRRLGGCLARGNRRGRYSTPAGRDHRRQHRLGIAARSRQSLAGGAGDGRRLRDRRR